VQQQGKRERLVQRHGNWNRIDSILHACPTPKGNASREIVSHTSTAAFNNANLAYVAQMFVDDRQFPEGDHMVSLDDDLQDVSWRPRGAMGKHERLWRTCRYTGRAPTSRYCFPRSASWCPRRATTWCKCSVWRKTILSNSPMRFGCTYDAMTGGEGLNPSSCMHYANTVMELR